MEAKVLVSRGHTDPKPQSRGQGRLVRRLLSGSIVLAIGVPASLLTAAPAHADIVTNDVVAGTDGRKVIGINKDASKTIKFWVTATNDDPTNDASGCNATGGHPATMSLTTSSSVTITPSTLNFTGCDEANARSATFASASAGTYDVAVAMSGGKNNSKWNTTGATFSIRVVDPNTAPTVTVNGVIADGRYEHGAVPSATCNVDDREDGASTFAATLSAVTGPLASYGLGSRTASCSATDSGGLTATASATYTIVDTTAPVLTVPGDITEEAASAAGATASWSATATDSVDSSPSVSCNPASGGNFAIGTTGVTCTATDAAGNQANGSFRVVIQDTTKPVLSLPSDKTIEATGPAGTQTTYSASANDSVDGPLTPECSPASGSTFALGTAPVACLVTDRAGNQSAGGFSVTVVDTTAPSLTLPQDRVVEATGANGAKVAYDATASDLVEGSVTATCVAPSGSVFALGTTTVSCAAADSAGNRTSGSFTITVQDTTKPELTLPRDITTEATKSAGADVTYTASATDTVDGTVATVCAPSSGSTFAIATTLVQCSAEDAAGNRATGSFTVKIQDTTAPVLNGKPANQTLEATGPAGAVASWDAVTATDIVDADRPVSCTPASGATFPLGTTQVTCSAADTRGNSAEHTFEVKVEDTTAPDVTVPNNFQVEAEDANGAVVTWTGVSATDAVDPDVTATCSPASGSKLPLGATTVTCESSDSASNTGSKSFVVTVQDTQAPDVNVPGNITKEATGPGGAVVSWTGVNATDKVDGSVAVSCNPASGSTFELGETTVTCAATDQAGNRGEGAFVVTVQDTTAPEVTAPQDTTVEATEANGATVEFQASANDAVDGKLVATCSPESGSTFALGTTEVSCTATDAAGNSSDVKSFTVTVLDTTAPAITVPQNQTIEATGPTGAAVTYTASAKDLVDGAVTPTCTTASGSTLPLGSTTVTCSATDSRGNTSTKTFTITVVDKTAPTVTVPLSVNALATSSGGAVVSYHASGTDLVDGTTTANCTVPSGSTFAAGKTTVSCTATDAAGNTSAPKTFVVTVAFDFKGFLAPVDGNKVLNGIKAGSTAPIKWQVSNQNNGFISDLAIVSRTASGVMSCTGSGVEDLETYTTGSTSLRYDATNNQFIYNWQSPKQPGKCFRVDISFTDGITQSALFTLK